MEATPAARGLYRVLGATLRLGYGIGAGAYGYGVNLNGNGIADSSGLYLNGGTGYYFMSGLVLREHAPTTIHTYGSGNPILGGWDSNMTNLTVRSAASGSVIPSNVNLTYSTYGYVMNIEKGPNNATGNVVIGGVLSGSSANTSSRGGIQVSYQKSGAGSVMLTGTSTYGQGFYRQRLGDPFRRQQPDADRFDRRPRRRRREQRQADPQRHQPDARQRRALWFRHGERRRRRLFDDVHVHHDPTAATTYSGFLGGWERTRTAWPSPRPEPTR